MTGGTAKPQSHLSLSLDPSRQLLLEAGLEIALLAAAVSAIALLDMLPLSSAGVLVAVLCYGLMAVLILAGLSRHSPHRHFGPANTITLCRAVIGVLFVAIVTEALLGERRLLDAAFRWGLTGAALFALVMDGADGWAARRTKMASDFGARFDVETDGVFILSLALAVTAIGIAGPWVLASGLIYYGFRLAGTVWPWLAAPLFPSWRRKAVCVAQAAFLVAALIPVLPARVAWGCCVAGLALLVYSFVVDIIWLMRRAGLVGPI
jgi:phosphatidylglycerophosphate synthase